MAWKRVLAALLVAVPAASAPAPAQDAPAGEAKLLSEVRQLTFAGRRAGEGYFGGDGRAMIFQSEREPGNPFYQMYLMDLETGETRRVSPGIGKTTCGWVHPAGTKVMFSSTHEDAQARAKQEAELRIRAEGKKRRYAWDYDEHYDIYAFDLASGTTRNLTRAPGYDAEGSYSPDGRLIAFASNRHAYAAPLTAAEAERFARDKSYFMDIYIMNADGSGVRRLTDAPGYDGGPFFNADGTRIVWRRFSEDGARAEIHTMNVDGSDERRITRLGAMSWAPFFHPRGDIIIFSTNLQGMANFELYMVDAEGEREPVRVTHTDGFDGLPAFSPDGGRLAWTSRRSGNGTSQIFLADWNHAEARRRLGLDRPGTVEAAGQASRTRAAISAGDIKLHVGHLASEAMGGRLTGSAGERLAADYVAAAFGAMGLEPAGDDGTFFQDFPFTAGASPGVDNRLVVRGADGETSLVVDEDWRPLAFSGTGAVAAAPVVFAGYGIVTPGGGKAAPYDSYGDLDVGGKWVMVLRYLPEDIDREAARDMVLYADLRHKAAIAGRKGARGLIVVSGPNARVKERLVRFTFDAVGAAAGAAAVSLSDAAAARLLGHAGKDLKTLQDALDRGEPAKGFDIPGVTLEGRIDIRRQKRSGRNVLARLRSAAGAGRPVVAVGAHLDHLGRGEVAGSLARAGERGKVHFGADDNASGVAGLLEIARHLARMEAAGGLKAERDILFAAWSGEELGLLGSTHFVERLLAGKGPDAALSESVAAYLNMDMIGRLEDRLSLQGTGSSPDWPFEIERANAPVGLAIVTGRDAYLPTDTTPFYVKGVPVLNAFTGAHSEYSTPRDTADRINAAGTARVAGLMAGIARSLARRAETPAYLRLERPKGSVGRRHIRVYLGTIPDYAKSEVKGVKLSDVMKGGPAEAAGLERGDVIVGLGGTPVANIYDFMGSLNLLKAGEATSIEVMRGGRRLKLSITPAARE